MSRNYYSELHLHMVWHTKLSQPLLAPHVEAVVHQKLGAGRKLLEWQTGYGVVSFGTRDLEWVKAYVRNQKEHHANCEVFDRLERITSGEKEAEAEQ